MAAPNEIIMPKPNQSEAAILRREMEAERKRRDRAVNTARTRKANAKSGSHIPTPKRTRKDIMKELT